MAFELWVHEEVRIIGTVIGIRREDKNQWERRTPLTPKNVQALKRSHNIQTVIQPSKIRVFSDAEYQQAGATVQDGLSSCPVIFGVKEMPTSFFEPEKLYVFFSHTIKGQKHNMPMLKQMMSLKCYLIDYEKVADRHGRRLLFFGRYAGLAGMIDSLWALGKRLEWEGIANPFSSLHQTFEYATLEEAQQAVSSVGQRIKKEGLNPSLLPLICGIAGYGHVSRGVQEIFDLLPHQRIAPEDISRVFQNPKSSKNFLYKVVFEEKHLVEHISPKNRFDLQDYYDHPEKYRSVFETYLPYMTLLINTIYWSPEYPRFVTKKALTRLFESQTPPQLRVIGDISCDVEGAIECTLRTTQPDNPIFVYNPYEDKAIDGYEGKGVVVMAVDNLPCELPRAASIYFGKTLIPFVPEIATADFPTDFARCRLSPPIKNGIILYGGQLTPRFKYMKKFL